MNLSPADLKVINDPVNEIHQYFYEIKAIPVDAFEKQIKVLDDYFSDRIMTECRSGCYEEDHMNTDNILSDILKQFDLKNTLKAYQEIQQRR